MSGKISAHRSCHFYNPFSPLRSISAPLSDTERGRQEGPVSRGPGESTVSVDSTSAYGAGPVLVYALRARLEKYGDDVRRRPIVPCAIGLTAEKSCLPARPRLPAAGWSQGSGCLDSYLRMISSRSATAVNGSQLARWLCSLLSLGILA